MGHNYMKTDKGKISVTLCLYLFPIFIMGGCYAETYAVVPEPVYVSSPPPQTIVYAEGECPEGYVWISDYYHWNGYSWVLINGGCTYKPGYIWVAPTYIQISGKIKYVPGYWKPAPAHHVYAYPPPKPKKYYAAPPVKPGPSPNPYHHGTKIQAKPR